MICWKERLWLRSKSTFRRWAATFSFGRSTAGLTAALEFLTSSAACYKGRFIGLECKLPGGRLTELQKRAIEKMNRAGGIACRVENVEDVKRVIERADLKARE